MPIKLPVHFRVYTCVYYVASFGPNVHVHVCVDTMLCTHLKYVCVCGGGGGGGGGGVAPAYIHIHVSPKPIVVHLPNVFCKLVDIQCPDVMYT